ncbi:Sag1p [Lachancea thermotolerans CBS 6340]|uniref:KLTH0B02860p n=1 Tax=Lachancea thermotolerans (strain ATCC 56472 / CBS 6340 / NRRL Y-8284) TaxID=559295 RepID=C5DCG4_LACTC|nr:KLTH0B02860p [Lachancea thermotolerans CBS 6340]CAR21475.1 KLTH0B02860p [Lachancea thermotolerans CBS 6340]
MLCRMLALVLATSFFLGHTLATQIKSVSFEGLSIDSISSQSFPHKMWELSFEFTIEDVNQISESDYFLLDLPHVYRVKFSNDADYQYITMADGSDAFKCYASQQAAYKYGSSVLRCDAVRTFSSFTSLRGNLSIGAVFSNGGSSYEFELENSKYFKSGEQLVELSEKLSAVANFARAPDFDSYYYEGRTTTYGSMESYYLGLSCPDGYILGGTQVIDYSPGTQPSSFDCSDAQVQLSSDFNDWFFPESYQSFSGDYVCNGATLSISFDKIDSGKRIWVNNLQYLDASASTVYHSIYFDYTCTNTLSSLVYTTAVHQSPAFVIKDGVFTGSAVVDALSTSAILTTTTTTTTTWKSAYATTTTGSVSSGATVITIHVDTPGTSSTQSFSSSRSDSSESIIASTSSDFSKPTTSTLTVTSCVSNRCSKLELISPSTSSIVSIVTSSPSESSTSPSESSTPSSASSTSPSESSTPSSASSTSSSVSSTPSSVSSTPSSVSSTPSSESSTSPSESSTSPSESTTSTPITTFANRTSAPPSTGHYSSTISTPGFPSSARGSQSISFGTVPFTELSYSVSTSRPSSLVLTSTTLKSTSPTSSLSGSSPCLGTACFETVSFVKPSDSSPPSHPASTSSTRPTMQTGTTTMEFQTSSSSISASKFTDSKLLSSGGVSKATSSFSESTAATWKVTSSITKSTASSLDKSIVTTPSLTTNIIKSSETGTQSDLASSDSSQVERPGSSNGGVITSTTHLSKASSNAFLGSIAASSFSSSSDSATTTTKVSAQITSTPSLVLSSTSAFSSASFSVYEGLAARHKFQVTLGALASLVLYSFT